MTTTKYTQTWDLSKYSHDRIFRPKNLHPKVHALPLFLLTMKQCVCIIIRNLGLFYFMCKFQQFQSINTIGVSKFCTSSQIMLENTVFLKNLHNCHKFYTTVVCKDRDKSQLCIIQPLIADWECVRRLDTLNFGGWSNRPLVEQVLLIKPIFNLWIFKYREYSVFSFQYFSNLNLQ